jgi:hypothetical protein
LERLSATCESQCEFFHERQHTFLENLDLAAAQMGFYFTIKDRAKINRDLKIYIDLHVVELVYAPRTICEVSSLIFS